MNEIWKTIEDYPDYMISNMGRVKSLKNGKETILKPMLGKIGYYYVNLTMNGKRKVHYIHRLVSIYFIPNPENKPCIDHINTDRTDNRIENLRWCTQKENCNNYNTKIKQTSNKNHNSLPIIQFTIDGDFIRKWDCTMNAERALGIEHSNIVKCCKGRYKTVGNYKWKYYYKGIWIKKHIPLKYKKVA